MKTIDEIAAALQGYDPNALSADSVNAFLAELVEPVASTESLGLLAALGRFLAEDVVSPISVPPNDNSAMDGYAFRGAELSALEASRFKVVGTALAGKAWQGTVGAGECVKIMTGAIMPAGLDTVVPQEFAVVRAAGTPSATVAPGIAEIEIAPNLLQTGDNRRFKGEDLMQGNPALSKGELLTPAAVGLLASLNIPSVSVFRKLKVAYFSTGDEILSLGDAPREGAVYDSNRYTTIGMLTRLGEGTGIEVIDMGVVRDDPALLEAAFRSAAAQADAIITSGGVSVGEADYTKAMMQKLGSMDGSVDGSIDGSMESSTTRFADRAVHDAGQGAEQGAQKAVQKAAQTAGVAFWKIAMRPGRPMAVGRIFAGNLPVKYAENPYGVCASSSEINSEKAPSEPLKTTPTAPSSSSKSAILFGLPGNPVAVMVTMLAFVRPALLRMMGANPAKYAGPPLYLRAASSEPLRKKPGRTEYQRGIVTRLADGSLSVKTTGNQGSGVLSSMVQANGLIVLHHAQGNVAVGDWVDVMMLDGL